MHITHLPVKVAHTEHSVAHAGHLNSASRKYLDAQELHLPVDASHAVQLLDAQHRPSAQDVLVHSLLAAQVVPATFLGEHLYSALRKWVTAQV